MRLFIALWPDDSAVAALQSWAQAVQTALGGRIMRPADMHLTLAFLGKATDAQAQALAATLADWPCAGRAFTLARVGVFERARVAWAGPAEEGRAQDELAWLHRLHDNLWCRLEALGWQRDTRPFRPHISLLRGIRAGEKWSLRPAPVICHPVDCRLVASRPTHDASHYEVLARLPVSPITGFREERH